MYTPEDSTAETWMFGVRATAMVPHEVKKSRLRKTKKKYQKNLPAQMNILQLSMCMWHDMKYREIRYHSVEITDDGKKGKVRGQV